MTLDGRKIDHKTREGIRRKAIERIIAGEKPGKVIKDFGVHRSAVYAWIKRYKENGNDPDVLAYKNNHGPKSKLTTGDKKDLFKTITTSTPDEQKLESRIWNRETLQRYIHEHYRIKLSLSTVGRLLDDFGLASRKPLAAARAKNPDHVEKWHKEEYPGIRKEAKKSDASIYFLDKADVRSEYIEKPVHANKGLKKINKNFNFKYNPKMFYSISTKGVTHFMAIKFRFNAGSFIDLMRGIASVEKHNFFLIVYGTTVQGYKRKLKKLNDELRREIKVFHIKPSKKPGNHSQPTITHCTESEVNLNILQGFNQIRPVSRIVDGF